MSRGDNTVPIHCCRYSKNMKRQSSSIHQHTISLYIFRDRDRYYNTIAFPLSMCRKKFLFAKKSSGMEANIVITNNETIGKVCEVTDNKTKVM